MEGCAEAGDEGGRFLHSCGVLAGVSAAGQGGKRRLRRALAMGVPKVGGGGVPLGHMGETRGQQRLGNILATGMAGDGE